MSEAAVNIVHEHRLTLAEVLGWLVDDGLVSAPDADLLLKESRLKRLVAHPLVIIADQKWKSQQEPHRPLNLEGSVSGWPAGWDSITTTSTP
jgi:general secretion pathway protein E